MPYRQPGQRELLQNQFFANIENAFFHTSAQFSPNFRKDRPLKICWWFRTYFWATLVSTYNGPITNGSIRNTIWVVFFANLDALRYSSEKFIEYEMTKICPNLDSILKSTDSSNNLQIFWLKAHRKKSAKFKRRSKGDTSFSKKGKIW